MKVDVTNQNGFQLRDGKNKAVACNIVVKKESLSGIAAGCF